jgi:hypothetical protein
MQVKKDLIEIVGSMDLTGNPLDMLREFDFLLQFLQVLRRRFGLHLSSSGDNRSHQAVLPAAACQLWPSRVLSVS